MDIHLAYTSVAAAGFREDELGELLQQSRTYNGSVGITGVLLYVRGSFIQVLEGEEKVVKSLYERIEQDTRHTNVTLLLNRLITLRLFPDWTMGYPSIVENQADDTIDVLSLDINRNSSIGQGENLVFKMLKTFYENNRYNVVTTPHY